MKILLNHIGFNRKSSKYAIASCPDEEHLSSSAVFMLVKDDGDTVFKSRPGPRQAVNGWKNRFYYILDFSQVSVTGDYLIRIEDEGRMYESPVFRIADNLISDRTISDILFYFKSQRSSWRWDKADAHAPFLGGRSDRVNVSGGWYDASGDYSKYLTHLSYANFMNPQQTPLVVWSLLCLKDSLADSFHCGTLLEDRALEEGLYGADFLMRMQDPAGYFYTTVFDQWSKEPERRVIASFRGMEGILSADYQAGFRQGGGMAIAALARAARCSESGEYSSSEYLSAAVRGWEHLEEHNLEYLNNGRENIIDHYCALLAAVELYKTTEQEGFLSAAGERVAILERLYDPNEGSWYVEEESERPYFHASDAGLPIIALIEYHEIAAESSDMSGAAYRLIRAAVADLIKLCGPTEQNPFLLARQRVKAVNGETRDSFFMPHENETAYWWQGENARLASLAAAVRRSKPFFADKPSHFQLMLGRFADAQIDWILGRNPFDCCMMQGQGRNNPPYEEHYPNAPGGICNGITAGFGDENDIDFLPEALDGRGDTRWRWSEQWIPHAAWFLLAVSADLENKGRI